MKQTGFDQDFWTSLIFENVSENIYLCLSLSSNCKNIIFPKKTACPYWAHCDSNSTENFLRDAAVDLWQQSRSLAVCFNYQLPYFLLLKFILLKEPPPNDI